jgi:hypothetical protein
VSARNALGKDRGRKRRSDELWERDFFDSKYNVCGGEVFANLCASLGREVR